MKWLYLCLVATVCLYAHGGGGAREYRKEGQWENHTSYDGNGAWKNGRWNGPYYYHGSGWYINQSYFVGFTFYTCPTPSIASTSIWEVYHSDVAIYESWKSLDDITIRKAYYDVDYPYRLCNGTSCIRVKRAET